MKSAYICKWNEVSTDLSTNGMTLVKLLTPFFTPNLAQYVAGTGLILLDSATSVKLGLLMLASSALEAVMPLR